MANPRKTIAISLDQQIILKVDQIRDLIPRSRFIEKIIKDKITENGYK